MTSLVNGLLATAVSREGTKSQIILFQVRLIEDNYSFSGPIGRNRDFSGICPKNMNNGILLTMTVPVACYDEACLLPDCVLFATFLRLL